MTAGAGRERAFDFQPPAVGSSIRGLSIINMGLGEAPTGSNDPTAIGVGAPDVTVAGTTSVRTTQDSSMPAMSAAVCQSSGINSGVRIGGPDLADRNVIVGNDQTAHLSRSSGGDDWIVQGNYIGVAADGETAIGNSAPGGAGGLDRQRGQLLVGATNSPR
ncbi:MAG: hypothetical protein R2789_13485 [Microthrixaceae bacterium]